jgi:hypothetical protein
MALKIFTGVTAPLYWSVPSNWSGSTLPTTNGQDVILANNKTNIIIDTNINVQSLNNVLSGGSAAGGNFIVDYRSGNIVLTSSTINGGSVTILQLSLVSGQTITISGNTRGGTAANQYGIINNGYGTINIFGNISGGTSTSSWGLVGNGDAVFNIVGDIYGGAAGTTTYGIYNNLSNIFNITGNTIPSSFGIPIYNANNGIINYSGSPLLNATSNGNITNASDGIVNIYGVQVLPQTTLANVYTNTLNGTMNIYNDCYSTLTGSASSFVLVNNATTSNGTGTINIYANVYASGRSVSATAGIINNNNYGTINVYGNVAGGISANTIGISNTNIGGTINVYGNISGGTFSGLTPAIYSTIATNINVYGNCVANAYPALYSTNIGSINVVGGLVFNTASTPYYAYNLKIVPTATTITQRGNISNNIKTLTTSGYTYGLPFSGNVRSGVTYGYLNEYRGSMVIPLKSSVELGTLFDTGNTYGEAITNMNDLNVIFSSFTINYTGTT